MGTSPFSPKLLVPLESEHHATLQQSKHIDFDFIKNRYGDIITSR